MNKYGNLLKSRYVNEIKLRKRILISSLSTAVCKLERRDIQLSNNQCFAFYAVMIKENYFLFYKFNFLEAWCKLSVKHIFSLTLN